MNDLPWLRLYSDAVDNEKLRLLAFEDRWHFIAILCCKRQGIIDDEKLLNRKLAIKLGVQLDALDEIKRRLFEVDLIDEKWQPIGWDEHQFISDNSTERSRRYREKLKGNSNETLQQRCNHVLESDTDTDTDTDTEKSSSRRFTPPTQKEIEQFCSEKSIRIDTGKFFHYYQANGWNVGRKKMKSWQDAIRYWASSEKSPTKQQGKYRLTTEDIYADF